MPAEYKIIGGDGAEYGPATLEELRSWIRDGRVAGMTKVWRSDRAAWSPAAGYAELGGELARLHASAASSAAPCGFWARLGAYVIDAVILGAIFQLVWTQLGQSRLWALPVWPTAVTDAALQKFLQDMQAWANHALPFYYPIYFLYDVMLNGRFGATIGKMAIGARIVLWDGSPIGYRRAAWRWLAARVSDLFCFAGYVVIALRADKRALHDLLAGTRVIYKR
jgi:uncharacterized RDD family membrane protein YckC